MRSGSVRLGAALLLLTLAATGCPGGGSPSPAPTADSAPALLPPIVLSCEEAVKTFTSQASGTDVVFAGATLTGLGTVFGGAQTVPEAEDAGLQVPQATTGWRFKKVPVELAAGAAAVTVRLAAGADVAALAWVPEQVWTSGGRPDLTSRLSHAVTFEGCPDRPALYLGGLLAATADTCLPLTLSAAGEDERVARRLDGASCD